MQFPEIHFIVSSYASVTSAEEAYLEQLSVAESTMSLFKYAPMYVKFAHVTSAEKGVS